MRTEEKGIGIRLRLGEFYAIPDVYGCCIRQLGLSVGHLRVGHVAVMNT